MPLQAGERRDGRSSAQAPGPRPDVTSGAELRESFPEAAAHRLIFISGLVLLASAAVVLYLFNPATTKLWLPCPFHALTGLHCPGCGSVRAAHQLLHGNVLAALGYNPLMVLAAPFVGYAFISYGVSAARRRPMTGVAVSASWAWALLAVVLAYWVLRNVPLHPFALLAP